jgi:hypothetical protein
MTWDEPESGRPDVPAAVGLLNRRKFDAVIVDLQLGEQSVLILDEVLLSASNRRAVTFAISGNCGRYSFPKEV